MPQWWHYRAHRPSMATGHMLQTGPRAELSAEQVAAVGVPTDVAHATAGKSNLTPLCEPRTHTGGRW
jgi:hypothetical protein